MGDKKFISIKNLIKIGIICLCTIGFLWVAISGNTVNRDISSTLGDSDRPTGPISETQLVTQYFVPKYNHIEKIDVLFNTVNMEATSGNVILWLFEVNGTEAKGAKIPVTDIKAWDYTTFTLDAEVEAGKEYAYTLYMEGTKDTGPCVMYRPMLTSGPSEHKGMSYCEEGIDNASVAVRYYYAYGLSKVQICVYALFALFAGLVLWEAFTHIVTEKFLEKSISVTLVCRIMLTVLLALVLFVATYLTLVSKRFGGGKLDFITYGLGILGLGIFLFIAIWKSRFSIPCKEKILNTSNVTALVRIGAIAYYIVQYADYYNSGINYGHYLSTCHMNVAIGVFLLTFFSLKEIISVPTIIYSVIHLGFSYGWMFMHTYDVETTALYKVAIFATWALGIVVIRTVINLIRGKIRRFSWVYTILMVLFLTLMIAFRHGKQWPFLIVIYFGIFYLQKIEKDKMYALLNHFAWGVMISFCYITIQSLLYRPYHYMICRYPALFASEAIWGVYLSLVFAVLLTKIFIEHAKNKSFAHMWFYYLLYSFCSVYIIFSVSRTAMLVVAAVTVSLIVLLFTISKQYVVRMLKIVLFGLGITVLLLPGIYTLIRTVPAIVGKPLLHRYDTRYEVFVLEEDPADSPKYITVAKVMSFLLDRSMATILGNNQMAGGRFDEEGKWQDYPDYYLESLDNAYDRTGGRMDIYMAYLKNLNLTGHDEIALAAEKETYVHAHNAFLQVAHDYGIFTGIAFLLVGLCALIRSFTYARNKSVDSLFTLLPFTVIIAFGVASLTEWTFHPSVPFTLALFLMQAPLLSPIKKEMINEETGIEF